MYFVVLNNSWIIGIYSGDMEEKEAGVATDELMTEKLEVFWHCHWWEVYPLKCKSFKFFHIISEIERFYLHKTEKIVRKQVSMPK